MAAPPILEIPSTKKILAAIPWIDGDYQLVDYIYHLAQEKLYNYGEVILRHGEPPDGIYFIMSGLVKVSILCSFRVFLLMVSKILGDQS